MRNENKRKRKTCQGYNRNMIDRNRLAYRKSTAAVVINEKGEVLIVSVASYKENEWSIPGGGTEEGETAEQAIIRELGEELRSDNFEIIKKSQQVDVYDWPDEVIEKRLKEKGKTYRGQEKIQFWIKFTGSEEEIKIDPKEIREVKWVRPNELQPYLIFPNQYEKTKKLLEEFGII